MKPKLIGTILIVDSRGKLFINGCRRDNTRIIAGIKNLDEDNGFIAIHRRNIMLGSQAIVILTDRNNNKIAIKGNLKDLIKQMSHNYKYYR